MAEKDISEKILESYNDVFADIVNVLLFNGDQVIDPSDLTDQAPRSAYKADGKLREVERDVAKRWRNGNIRIACIGLENQTASDPYISLRVIGYDGMEYRAQLNSGKECYPVVTLVLYFGTEKHWDAPRSLHETFDILERLKPFVQDYKINLFEIAYLEPEQIDLFKSDFRIVADYFYQKRVIGDYNPRPNKIEHVDAVLGLLRVMTNDYRFEEVMNEIEEGESVSMCEVLDKIEAKGAAKAIENMAIEMLKMNLPLEVIEKVSKLSEGEIRALAAKIGVTVNEG